MDELFDLPQGPRLSNSIFKNRPLPPHARTKVKPWQEKNIDEEIRKTTSNMISDVDEHNIPIVPSVVYRQRNLNSSNRHRNILSQSPTLFYVTSPSIFDESSKSDTSSNPSTLSVNNFSMPFFFFFFFVL